MDAAQTTIIKHKRLDLYVIINCFHAWKEITTTRSKRRMELQQIVDEHQMLTKTCDLYGCDNERQFRCFTCNGFLCGSCTLSTTEYCQNHGPGTGLMYVLCPYCRDKCLLGQCLIGGDETTDEKKLFIDACRAIFWFMKKAGCARFSVPSGTCCGPKGSSHIVFTLTSDNVSGIEFMDSGTKLILRGDDV